jgi:8-oxo-dGTP pyrophosphatase MutT (NUDIX family)
MLSISLPSFFYLLTFTSLHPKRSVPSLNQTKHSDNSLTGAGVTIFHLATSRIVICKDTRNGVFFLPKGRKDASEETTITAIREGYEESGYRCRLLPLPLPHLQPSPATLDTKEGYESGTEQKKWVIEPLATRMMPVAREYQYLLFWYAAETVSEDIEQALNAADVSGDGFVRPESFPENMTLEQREAMDMREGGVYEPKRHEGTGVDEDEAFYVGMLVGVEEAMRLLGGTSADVVGRAWEGVCLRRKMEEKIK